MFGYGLKRMSGRRPLLVVLVDYQDAGLSNGINTFRPLLFGPGYPNLVDFFSAASGGVFTWQVAGIVRVQVPFTGAQLAQLTRQGNTSAFDTAVLQQAAQTGVDFDQYDRNDDGVLSVEEMVVLSVNTNLGITTGGQARQVAGVRVDNVTTGPGFQMAFVDEFGDLNLWAHELFHALGFPEHIYGSNFSPNRQASFFARSFNLGATPGPVQLDPWNRMLAGWLKPRVFWLSRAGNATFVSNAEQASFDDLSQNPILLFDSRRGFNEFFIIEYRYRSRAGYDAGAIGTGVAIWYVQRAAGTTLVTFDWPPPVRAKPLGNTYANYLIGPNPIGPNPAPQALWTQASGVIQLNWGDGTDSKFRLQVGGSSPYSTQVAWWHAEQPFLPRLDRVLASSVNSPGLIVVEGMLPIKGMLTKAQIMDELGRRIAQWTIPEPDLNINRTTLNIPPGIPTGRYRLSLSMGNNPADNSNELWIDVARR